MKHININWLGAFTSPYPNNKEVYMKEDTCYNKCKSCTSTRASLLDKKEGIVLLQCTSCYLVETINVRKKRDNFNLPNWYLESIDELIRNDFSKQMRLWKLLRGNNE